jgi:DNA-directed RNA polymerase beta' subunit
MEDLMVQNDGTVRDANMNIVQIHYGEDGINSTKIEAQPFPITGLSDDEIAKEFGLEGAAELVTQALEAGINRGDDLARLQAYKEQVIADRKMLVEGVFRSGRQGSVYSPVNLERLIVNIKIKFGLSTEKKTTLTPLRVLDGIDSLMEKTQSYNTIWAGLVRHYLSPMNLIVKERFTETAFDTLCEVLVTKNWRAWAQPGEYVGIIAAQSIGEPSTQMTLNSVDWDTKVMIAKNGEIICPQIGEFIDAHMDANPDKIQIFPNNQLYMKLDDGNDWKAISCDEHGKVVWTTLEAITKHPVVNEDGTNTIVEVELSSGRVVKGTKGKSFLTLIDGKVQDINGSDLQIGDVIPIANTLAIETLGLTLSLQVKNYLPPSEWLYGTDVHLALAELHGTDRHWFQKNNGKLFTVPYSRSDAFREAFVDGKNTNATYIKEGFVYPARTRPDVSQIPDEIALNEKFGFFVGAYLAEGMSNTTQVNITNNDAAYLNKVNELMSDWNVGTHTVCEERYCEKTDIKGTTTSLVIHSTLLAALMQKLFGRVSYEKTLPDWVFQAPHEFIQGLVDGYISGDGTVCKKSGTICAGSVSKDLLVRFSTLLSRYGIFSTMTNYMPNLNKFDSVQINYTLRIPVHYSKVFAQTFLLSMSHKQEILDYYFNLMDKGQESRRGMTGDVIWDTIKGIKEVTPIKGLMYDVTVDKTLNFMTYDGIIMKDTFHLAGVASKSNVTRGVPRLKELLKVTQNPKAVSLTIPLLPEYSNSIEKAREVAQELELTLLRDLTIKTAIYYDPSDDKTVLSEDRDLIAFYKLFEEASTQEGEGDQPLWSKWILRLELNREKMFDRNITMDDIMFVLRKRYDKEIHMIFSDFNSQKLVMRIRIAISTTENTRVTDPSSLDALASYKKFQNKLLNSVVIRGYPGIKAVTFRKGDERYMFNETEKKYVTKEEYILDTDGSNFLEVMNHPAVDGTRVVSTHVHDIYANLGIEATREVLYNEINTLFEEGQINYRHLGLLVDVMTRAGRLMSVDRYGINKLDIGPLAKASFEETERILLKAAVFGEIDPITGVSSNIMTGQPIRGGTSFSQILLDEDAVINLQRNMEELAPMDLEKDVEDEKRGEDDMCSPSRLRMNITLPTATTNLDEDDVDLVVLEG